MKKEKIKAIIESSEFKELVSKRWSISLILTAIMLIVYFGFILLLAFDKSILAQKIGEHITLGIPVGLGVIVIAWLLTGVYVKWANTTYDAEVRKIKDRATGG